MAELARKQLESAMENAEQTTIAVLQRDVAHIDRGLTELKEETQRRFDGVDKRFMWLLGAYGAGCVLLLSAYGVGFVKLLDRQDAMRQELTGIMDKRFEVVDRKFEAVDRRFDVIDQRFDALEAKFDRQSATLEQLRKLLSGGRSIIQ